ncbi:hypothetical protein V7F78_09205 [Cutibacterium avidum]|uniref:Uncharacterized protein n=1 Tax=Cutibacterium avidum TaxID=33010 RepID=A0AB35XIL5_9ACTN
MTLGRFPGWVAAVRTVVVTSFRKLHGIIGPVTLAGRLGQG